MNITKNLNGSLTVSDLDSSGYLMSETYYGYTRKEATEKFRQAMRTNYTYQWNTNTKGATK